MDAQSLEINIIYSVDVTNLPDSCAPRQEAPGKGGTSTLLAAGYCHDPHLASAAGRRTQPEGRNEDESTWSAHSPLSLYFPSMHLYVGRISFVIHSEYECLYVRCSLCHVTCPSPGWTRGTCLFKPNLPAAVHRAWTRRATA